MCCYSCVICVDFLPTAETHIATAQHMTLDPCQRHDRPYRSQQHAELISETADLWFHTLVMLHKLDLSSAEVLTELERRFDLSGLVEKANRNK